MEVPRLCIEQNHFPHTPLGSPAKVLKTLDLLAIKGKFTSHSDNSRGSSVMNSPANPNARDIYKKSLKKAERRNSFTSDIVYDHTISDEFSHIVLQIKERRRNSFESEHSNYSKESSGPNSPKRVTIYSKTIDNKIVLAKYDDDDNEDQIEIIDLDEDEDYLSAKSEHPQMNLYPNCDVNVWLRSCEKEVIEPIEGTPSGEIPKWLNGALLRNGPGSIKLGDIQFNHLFDSAALLHRFNIKNGDVTYQCRFLQSDSYKRNLAANRVVVSEFATASVPDPCQSIFQRISTLFKQPSEANSDNAMISIYPFGDEYFAFTETPVIHKFDPETLETLQRMNLHEKIGIINHTSHPHVMSDGTVYNLGMTLTKTGPAYNIICFPHGERMFEDARIVCSIPTRWRLHPGYMHSFGITENYFIIIEQPMTVSIPATIKCSIKNEPMIGSLKWFPEQRTYIYVIDRDTKSLKHTFQTESFFYLHTINQYEKDDHIVLDICCYRDPTMLNCMYVESMKNMQSNPDYAKMFRAKPLRFVLPLKYPETYSPFNNYFSKSAVDFDLKHNMEIHSGNLVKLPFTNATAHSLPDGSVYCKPEMLCNLGCETPRINYEKFLGVEYQYFYAISSDVDAENPGTLIKVDTINKTKLTWCEPNCYPSEPIFVPTPNAEDEDDGVVLSAMVWGHEEVNKVGLLVLCAKTMTELGRCVFETPGPVPKCLHGWFAESKDLNNENYQ